MWGVQNVGGHQDSKEAGSKYGGGGVCNRGVHIS